MRWKPGGLCRPAFFVVIVPKNEGLDLSKTMKYLKYTKIKLTNGVKMILFICLTINLVKVGPPSQAVKRKDRVKGRQTTYGRKNTETIRPY